MATDDAPEADPDLDLIAASLRADASDLGTFTEALAVKLEEALPGGVQIQRSRPKLLGPKLVRAIVVDAGGERLQLRVTDRGALETTCARVSGGIVLKTDPVDTDEWLRRLSGALAAQARLSQTTRQALERLLNG
jgi:hypothetical protein